MLNLIERLELIIDWYKGMVSDETGRLLYVYDPDQGIAVANGSPIRDIASIWDIEQLSHFLGRRDLMPLVERSLAHYRGYLVERNGNFILDSRRMGEPSGIAHSAFMILSLLGSELPQRIELSSALADAIVRQQRGDGSYRIYFGEERDEGLEFYPGEAMLALMEVYRATGDPKYLESVERGFTWFERFDQQGHVAEDLSVFYASWQSQYGALLHVDTRRDSLRRRVRDFVFALHDRVVESGFYESVQRAPLRQSTVEVACALEGVNDAYTIAVRERDVRHIALYERCIRIALSFLLRAQCIANCAERERGGFGHSLTNRTQRIDVTGHVVGGFIKTARNGVVPLELPSSPVQV